MGVRTRGDLVAKFDVVRLAELKRPFRNPGAAGWRVSTESMLAAIAYNITRMLRG